MNDNQQSALDANFLLYPQQATKKYTAHCPQSSIISLLMSAKSAPMQLTLTKASAPTGAGMMAWSRRQGQGMSSKGHEIPDRNNNPTEKKAMSNNGASLSLKKGIHAKPKKAEAKR